LAAKVSVMAAFVNPVNPGTVPKVALPAACTINEAPAAPYSAATSENWAGSVMSHELGAVFGRQGLQHFGIRAAAAQQDDAPRAMLGEIAGVVQADGAGTAGDDDVVEHSGVQWPVQSCGRVAE
jgi:hypothetical protein